MTGMFRRPGDRLLVRCLPYESELRANVMARFGIRHEDVEDVVQRVYGRIVSLNADPAMPIKSLLTHLYQALQHVAGDRRREEPSMSQSVSDHAQCADQPKTDSLISAPAALDRAAQNPPYEWQTELKERSEGDDIAKIVIAISNLPDQTRRVATLRLVYGFGHSQIAARLRVSGAMVECCLAEAANAIFKDRL
jgi:DNA-directed RNA polymerase specialized sigma24 family protein